VNRMPYIPKRFPNFLSVEAWNVFTYR